MQDSYPNRLKDQFQIEQETAVTNVLHIHSHPVGEFGLSITFQLPDASQARNNFKAFTLPHQTFNRLIDRKWPWPDQRHVPSKNVDQLRQFVNTAFSQVLADFRKDADRFPA